MSEITSNSAYDLHLISVEITADRFDEIYEVALNVAEIDIFEHLDLPYMTGHILLIDSSDLFTQIGFQGTEKISIKVKIFGDNDSKETTKKFVITDIHATAPSTDTSEVLSISIIEEHAYLNRLVTVSKAYDGKPEEIVAKILKDKLNKTVVVPDEFSGSAVPPMKVVIPNTTALDAARWMKDRIVSESGMPFFLYSTLNSDNLYLKDLGYILKDSPMNESRPYVYGQAFTRYSTTQNVTVQARNIEAYRLSKSENMFNLAEQGTLNSTYTFVDTIKEKNTDESSIKVNMSDVIKEMTKRNIISGIQKFPIYDDKFTLNDKTISEYNPSVMTQIVTSNTFTDFANYYEAEDLNQQKLKAYSRALRYYLLKSPVQITMPGFDFLGRGDDITIGNQISLEFLRNDPSLIINENAPLDERRTGDYIIYAMRHMMRPGKYTVAMTVVKLANRG